MLICRQCASACMDAAFRAAALRWLTELLLVLASRCPEGVGVPHCVRAARSKHCHPMRICTICDELGAQLCAS